MKKSKDTPVVEAAKRLARTGTQRDLKRLLKARRDCR
jgi:hypothetical protein